MSAQPSIAPEPGPPAEPLRPVEERRVISPQRDSSPLRNARLRRKLTEEQVAGRAGLFPDEVRWLEEGRVYRFRSSEDALLAAVLYTAALGLDRREARSIAGFAPPRGLPGRGLRRLALVLLLTAVVLAVVLPAVFGRSGAGGATVPAVSAQEAALPPPSSLTVDVMNGNGDINWTHTISRRIGGLGYRIGRVVKAARFDYQQTVVYFEPGGGPVAERLGRQLGVPSRPLPGGNNPRRLVVIVGPQRGPG